ncbi:MAG: RAMP superfamily CRISPR-associated protein [Deltaproteobacteria bacterium]|nr:RAMP superfamily CRISPR-associated protein [Deltaproteobacteria bacterium]
MSEIRPIFVQKGKLKVLAKGYWFTLGGDKGSFGYYPHLKEENGFPIFPDTQIKGDLRAAAEWLSKLYPDVESDFVSELFGDDPKGRERASKLFFSDLCLTFESKKRWEPSRFEIKPRISISDDTRTVKPHMLVNLEMAYLDGLELESDIYMGYFEDSQKLEKARVILDRACLILSGFGNSRSRGYGRGILTIEWGEPQRFSYVDDLNLNLSDNIRYTIKALTNVRLKPVNPGSTQSLSTLKFIPANRLNGWFVKIYHMLFGEWPEEEFMNSISFSDLYPSIEINGVFHYGLPSPCTTLKDEGGKVADIATTHISPEENENLFSTKTKPLPDDHFVTEEENPHVFQINIGKRTRNQIGLNFTSAEEKGLYVQEFVWKGTLFSGVIGLKSNDRNQRFLRRALYILNCVNPIIGGSVFSIEEVREEKRNKIDSDGPLLVINHRPFEERLIGGEGWEYIKERDRVVMKDANRITICTNRGYRTVLRRPKRPLICIRPGSVLFKVKDLTNFNGLFKWHGFGKQLAPWVREREQRQRLEKPELFKPEDIIKEYRDLLSSISRSQIGFFKEFTNRYRPIKEIIAVSSSRAEKYRRKGKNEWERLFITIKGYADEDETGEKLRAFINAFVDAYLESKAKPERRGFISGKHIRYEKST